MYCTSAELRGSDDLKSASAICSIKSCTATVVSYDFTRSLNIEWFYPYALEQQPLSEKPDITYEKWAVTCTSFEMHV